MQIRQFPGLNLISGYKADELAASIASKTEGSHVVGVWCAMTGFAVRAVVVEGLPVQWFIRGPMSLEDARAELMGTQPEVSARLQ